MPALVSGDEFFEAPTSAPNAKIKICSCSMSRVDKGREVRWEKDAVTVEIGFALLTGALLAAAVFGVGVGGVVVGHLGGVARHRVLVGAALAGGVWRVVRVLRRFEAWRREGT
jgi:hypothetical protein